MRRLIATAVVATMFVACGGSAATPTAGTAGSGAFAIAGLTANIVPGGPVDPATFATSLLFP